MVAQDQGELINDGVNNWVHASEIITWSNMTAVYEGTSNIFPDNKNFNITITDNDNGKWIDTSSSGKKFEITTKADSVSDYSDLHHIKITDIPGLGRDVSDCSFTIGVDNDGPKDEGSLVTISFSNQYDPGIYDTFSYSFDFDNNGVYDIEDQIDPSASYTWGDNGVYTVKGRIKDDDGGYNEYTTSVVIKNVPPTITELFMDQPNPQFILPQVHDLIFVGNFHHITN